MVLNGHNLEITKFAGSGETKGFNLNTLHVSNEGTTATDGWFLVRVSDIPGKKSKPFESFLIEASTTVKFTDDEFDSDALTLFNRIDGKRLKVENIMPSGSPDYKFSIRASHLLRAALSALMFSDKKDAVLDVELRGTKKPIKIMTKCEESGQDWTSLVMPSVPGSGVVDLIKADVKTEDLALDAEQMDEFEAAIRAAEMMGM